MAKSQGVQGCESKGIKGVYKASKHRVGGDQTAWNNYYMGNRVGAGQVPRSVIDGIQLVFGPGLSGLSRLSVDNTKQL